MFRELLFTRKRIAFFKSNIKRSVGRVEFSNFMIEISNVYNSKFDQVKQNQKIKLDILIHLKYGGFLKEVSRNVDKWIVNLTKITIPENVRYILSLGPKFNINSETIESGINLVVDENEKNLVRNEICNILQNEKIHKACHTPKDFKNSKLSKGF